MPLSELFRLATEKKKPCSFEIPSRSNDELMELVFENGQIKMQSQSTRTPARIGKYGGVQSILDDISPLGKLDVISEDDDDVVPWLRSYGDAPPHDHSSEFLSGPSGVTAMQNGLDGPTSGVSDVIVSIDKSAPVDGSDMLNFSHFLRPPALIKAKIPTPASLGANNAVESKLIGQCNEALSGTVKSRRLVVQGPEEARLDKLCRELSDDMKEEFRISVNSAKGDSEGQKDRAIAMPASSVCSGNGAKRVISCEKTRHSKRKFRDIEESESRSDDIETESTGVTKPAPARVTKRTRAAEVHNLSERRRRDRINEKMRALQELIPNCSKVDKASMLDEAIEYLKTLQFQVQIMSMGSGLCMRPMMFPSGMHPPHYSPMSYGIGMGMGYGMGMPDLSGRNPGCPSFPMQVPGLNSFLRVPPLYGRFDLHNLAPFPGPPPVNSATGLRSCADILKNNNSDSKLDAEATQLQDQSGTVQEKDAAATS